MENRERGEGSGVEPHQVETGLRRKEGGKAGREPLTAERLRELFHYDPDTGLFTWRNDAGRWGRIKAGSVAGGKSKHGYVVMNIDRRHYMAHRLAVLYVTGEWPAGDVDHKYGVKHDNRWSEVRPATRGQNQQNERRARASNKCGLLGVCMDTSRGHWKAQIMLEGRQKFLGYFDTPELAHAAYLDAKARLHPFQTLVS